MNQVVSFIRRAALGGSLLLLLTVTGASQVVVAEPNAAQARFEEDFLIETIDHHFAGVKLAEVAVERASHDDLRALAASIRTAQTLEIERLQARLEEWYDVTYEPEVSQRQQREIDEFSELSGDDFDRAFLVAMSLHHAEALRSAADALLHAFHADLIDAARTMLATQGDEVALMRVWLNQWYGITEVAWSAVVGAGNGNGNGNGNGPAKNQDPETPLPPMPTPAAPTTPTTVTTPSTDNAPTNVTTPTTTTTTPTTTVN